LEAKEQRSPLYPVTAILALKHRRPRLAHVDHREAVVDRSRTTRVTPRRLMTRCRRNRAATRNLSRLRPKLCSASFPVFHPLVLPNSPYFNFSHPPSKRCREDDCVSTLSPRNKAVALGIVLAVLSSMKWLTPLERWLEMMAILWLFDVMSRPLRRRHAHPAH
jgi:hypothetical protein